MLLLIDFKASDMHLSFATDVASLCTDQGVQLIAPQATGMAILVHNGCRIQYAPRVCTLHLFLLIVNVTVLVFRP